MDDYQEVLALINRLRPLGVCDACVDSKLGRDDIATTRRRVHGMVGQQGISRKIGKCCLCSSKRTITQGAASG